MRLTAAAIYSGTVCKRIVSQSDAVREAEKLLHYGLAEAEAPWQRVPPSLTYCPLIANDWLDEVSAHLQSALLWRRV